MSVQDLTNTTWVLNDTILLGLEQSFNVNIEYNDGTQDLNFSSIVFQVIMTPIQEALYGLYFDSYAIIELSSTVTPQTSNQRFIITGGTDVTNAALIAWLEENATMQTSQLTVDMSSLSGWSNVSVGNHTLTIKAKATGYRDSAPSTGVSFTKAASGYEVELDGAAGLGEYVYVQINDDPTWYYAQMDDILGFNTDRTNIPNVYDKASDESIGIPNVSKIKIGTQGNPAFGNGPEYQARYSTGDFTNLTFTATGGSAPAYVTNEITMTQNSRVNFRGND